MFTVLTPHGRLIKNPLQNKDGLEKMAALPRMACRLFFGRAPMLRYSCGTSFTGGQQLHWLECQVPDASLLLQLKDSRSQLVPSPWTLHGCMVKLSLPSLGKIRIGGGSSRAPLTLPILDVRFENGIYCLIFSRTCHVSRDLNHSKVWEGKERKAQDSTGFFYQKQRKALLSLSLIHI